MRTVVIGGEPTGDLALEAESFTEVGFSMRQCTTVSPGRACLLGPFPGGTHPREGQRRSMKSAPDRHSLGIDDRMGAGGHAAAQLTRRRAISRNTVPVSP